MKRVDVYCDDCEKRMPALTEENQTLFECFTLCASQLRVSMEPFAMDWNVAMEVARAMNIEIDAVFFRLLRAFESALIESLRTKH